jgi:aspartyl/asparaginyl-tRNA synthetase
MNSQFSCCNTAVKTPSDMAVANTNANNNTPSTEQSEAHRHFFGSPAFLTVSGQLHAEMFACAMSYVFRFFFSFSIVIFVVVIPTNFSDKDF